MRPSREQLDLYFERVEENYQTAIQVLQLATNSQIVLMFDKDPESSSTSAIEMLLSTAFLVVAPAAFSFFRAASSLSDARKKSLEMAETLVGLAKTAGTTYQETKTKLDAARSEQPRSKLKVMDAINAMGISLIKQKALIINYKLLHRSLLPYKSPNIDRLFDQTIWAAPPMQLGSKADDVLYAFQYVLARIYVNQFLTLKIVATDNGGPWTTNDTVLKVDYEGISQNGIQWIYNTFDRSMDASLSDVGLIGAPLTKNIRPVRDYRDLGSHWGANVVLVNGPTPEQLERVRSGPYLPVVLHNNPQLKENKKLTQELIWADRLRRGVNPNGQQSVAAPTTNVVKMTPVRN